MILSDRVIRAMIEDGEIGVTPYDPERVGPCSLDVTLGAEFAIPERKAPGWKQVLPSGQRLFDHTAVDPRCRETYPIHQSVTATEAQPLVLYPGMFVLGTTGERLRLPNDLRARLEGCSSYARLGVMVHITGGFIDPGFEGEITLEIVNVSPNPVLLCPGEKIGQLEFSLLIAPAEVDYAQRKSSKYCGQTGPTESRQYRNSEG